nr:tripartite motif-containing protein 30A-like [Cavia porcellus]
MEEAVEEYQEKLHQVLEKLTKDEKECEKWKTHIKQERTSWKDVKDFVERNKLLTVQQPRTFPKEKRIVFKSPDLRGILQSHQAPGIPAPSNSPNVVLSAPSRPTAVTNYPSEYSLGGATATNPVTTSVIPTGSWIR